MALKRLPTTRLADPALERVRQEIVVAILELQSLPAAGARVIAGVVLADGIATPVAHGLGRPASWVQASCPRGPSSTGRIEEVRTGTGDRSKFVTLKATGWGATITVDVLVL